MSNLPNTYPGLLASIKSRFAASRIRAAAAVNSELVLLYWEVGKEIAQREAAEGWGAGVIDSLSADLRRQLPGTTGLSARNLRYMRDFAKAWPDISILQQVAAKLPWYHNCVLLQKLHDPQRRLWYARQAIEHGWTRVILEAQIDTQLDRRQGTAVTNFTRTLPAHQAELAHQILKDPYTFDFLALGPEAHERELEDALVIHLSRFLIELGKGFAFVGRQFELKVGGESFFLDLLFYHIKLHCYVVVELKMTDFVPEFAGKMNFYLSAVDDLCRDPRVDAPSIGILLCRGKNNTVVEYALRDLAKPIGVSKVELQAALPAELSASMPTIEELEAGLRQASQD